MGEAGKVGQHLLRRRRPRQHGARLGKKEPAGLRQHDAAANPVEQPRGVARLQRGNGGAGRRWGEVELLGGAGDMLKLGDGDEDAQLLQCHPPPDFLMS